METHLDLESEKLSGSENYIIPIDIMEDYAYQTVVLREDQIDKIADRVIERLEQEMRRYQ